MTNEQLHPSVAAFKQFINTYPLLCAHIHENESDVQALYEKWAIDGEDDVYWDVYKGKDQARDLPDKDKEDAGKVDVVKTIIELTKNMDLSNVQKHVDQISKTVLSVQEIINQFNSNTHDSEANGRQDQSGHFFQWMRD